MKLQGSLTCLLLALCLGSGEAGPLPNGEESGGAGAIRQGIGEAVGHGAGEAASTGTKEALGQEGGSAARGPGLGDAFSYKVGEAAGDLGRSVGEAGRQAENIVRQGIDAIRSSGSWVSLWEARCGNCSGEEAASKASACGGCRFESWLLCFGNVPGKAMGDARVLGPLDPWGRCGRSSWLEPNPVLAVVAIWGGNQWIEDFSVHLSVTLPLQIN